MNQYGEVWIAITLILGITFICLALLSGCQMPLR